MAQKNEVVIVAAVRTAIGKFGGSLAKLPAAQMGAELIRALLAKTQLPAEQINEVILGQVLAAGMGQNPARQALIKAGLPCEIPAMTVNKVCGSGLKAIVLGAQSIQLNQADIVIAGGQENMSAAPHVFLQSREGIRMGHGQLLDSMLNDGLWDAFYDYHMGITAENIAHNYQITRAMQDEFAVQSQQKAHNAQANAYFKAEIIPISLPQKKGDPIFFAEDEGMRKELTIEQLTKLKPVFDAKGTVTAGNASGINDGAAAVLLMSAQRAQQLNLKPMARIVSYASAGVDPQLMGMGPVPAVRLCLQRAAWSVSDLARIEVNEAFAAQAIAVNQQIGWDLNKVNVNGGAIALGHPIGASGCRILVSLLHEMQRSHSAKGLAALCIGGGMGIAMAVEQV